MLICSSVLCSQGGGYGDGHYSETFNTIFPQLIPTPVADNSIEAFASRQIR